MSKRTFETIIKELADKLEVKYSIQDNGQAYLYSRLWFGCTIYEDGSCFIDSDCIVLDADTLFDIASACMELSRLKAETQQKDQHPE